MKILKVEPRGSSSLQLYISSGDEEQDYCYLCLAFWRWHITLRLPRIIPQHKVKVFPTTWDEATVARLGRNWYWNVTERRYGAYLYNNHFYVYLGLCSHDSSTEQKWSMFLPWSEKRMVRHTLYWPYGGVYWEEGKSGRTGVDKVNEWTSAKDGLPKMSFKFKDFDGEELQADTYIEEREWRQGTGLFRWLSWFVKPLVVRSLDIEFSGETGKRKGSWKGGTIGHSIEIKDEREGHEDAFKRYCAKHEMTYIGRTPDPIPKRVYKPEAADCQAQEGTGK